MGEDKKRALVLELLAQDMQAGLDNAVSEKRQLMTRFVEELWDKYRVTLPELRADRVDLEGTLDCFLKRMAYS